MKASTSNPNKPYGGARVGGKQPQQQSQQQQQSNQSLSSTSAQQPKPNAWSKPLQSSSGSRIGSAASSGPPPGLGGRFNNNNNNSRFGGGAAAGGANGSSSNNNNNNYTGTSANGASNNTFATELALRERFIHLVTILTGQKVTITLKSGTIVSGVLHTATPFSHLPQSQRFKYVLKAVTIDHESPNDTSPAIQPGQTLILDMQSVVQLHLKSIRKDQLVGNNATSSNDAFVTDTEISRAAAKGGSGPRELVLADSVWTSGGTDVAIGDSLLSGSSHRGYNRSSSNDDLPINSRAAKLAGTTPIGSSSSSNKGSGAVLSGSIAGWDQFKANKELFNVTGGYDENVYTTPLDYSGLDSVKIAHAEKLAREIESAPTQNIHQAEERGQIAQTDNAENELDEEDKYSGVLPANRVQASLAVTPPELSATSAPSATTATSGSKASTLAATTPKPKLNYAQAAKQISSSKTTSVPPGFVAEKPPVKVKKEVKALEDTSAFKKEATPAPVKADESTKDKTQRVDKKIETDVQKSTEPATAKTISVTAKANKSTDSFDVKKLSEAIDATKAESIDAPKPLESAESKKKPEPTTTKKPSESSVAKKETQPSMGKGDAKKEENETKEAPKVEDKEATAVEENAASKAETHEEEAKEKDTTESTSDAATTEDIVAAAAAAKSKLNANAKEFTLNFSAKPFTPPTTMIQSQTQQPQHQVPPTQMALQPQHMHQQPHHPQFQPPYIDHMTGMPIQMHSAPHYGSTAAHMQGHHGIIPGVHMMGAHHMMGANQPHHYPGQYQVMRGYPGQYIDPHAVSQTQHATALVPPPPPPTVNTTGSATNSVNPVTSTQGSGVTTPVVSEDGGESTIHPAPVQDGAEAAPVGPPIQQESQPQVPQQQQHVAQMQWQQQHAHTAYYGGAMHLHQQQPQRIGVPAGAYPPQQFMHPTQIAAMQQQMRQHHMYTPIVAGQPPHQIRGGAGGGVAGGGVMPYIQGPPAHMGGPYPPYNAHSAPGVGNAVNGGYGGGAGEDDGQGGYGRGGRGLGGRGRGGGRSGRGRGGRGRTTGGIEGGRGNRFNNHPNQNNNQVNVTGGGSQPGSGRQTPQSGLNPIEGAVEGKNDGTIAVKTQTSEISDTTATATQASGTSSDSAVPSETS